MKVTIWKYEISACDNQSLFMPAGAIILSVQMQLNKPCIWALVDSLADMEERTFEVYGTGHILPTNDKSVKRNYIGTFQLNGGFLVFHLFERVAA